MRINERSRLLLVEDDPVLGDLIAELLADDYDVTLAPDGQKGLHLGLTGEWEVMVIDRGLPVLDGLELLAAMRRQGVATPALILTALGTTAQKIEGLDAGANDYMTKPFDAGELRARLRAITRRFESLSAQLLIGDWTLAPDSRLLSSPYGERIALTAKESELLALLAGEPEKVFSRAELITALFHPQDGPGVIDTYVHYLRRKVARSVIRTVRGVGYQIGDAS